MRTLRSYHNSHPYRYGMKKAEVHMTYLKKVKANVFDLYMELLVEKGVLRRHQEFLALPEFEIPKDERYQRLHDQMITAFEDAKFLISRNFLRSHLRRRNVRWPKIL